MARSDTPLERRSRIGLRYCLVGVVLGFIAHAVGGWAGVVLMVVAALMVLAGLWTTLFTGLWPAVRRRI